MKIQKIITSLFTMIITFTLVGQDIITKQSYEEIKAQILEITPDYVKFKRQDKPNGPTYAFYLHDVWKITYADGSTETFNDQLSKGNSFETTNNNTVTVLKNDYYLDKRDGKKYEIIKVGHQVWFRDNLEFVSENALTSEFDRDCIDCGRYYNWQDANKVCPEGWHLPTDDEWKLLEKELGMLNVSVQEEGLRETPLGYAKELLKNGKTGLDFKHCGHVIDAKYNGAYGKDATFWTATEKNDGSAYVRIVEKGEAIFRGNKAKKIYHNVRCLKD